MRYIYLIIAILSLTLYLSNCKKNSTDPPINGSEDTTSHNIIWELDTLGIYPSFIRDVAVINENNIWAVGEIHTPETDKSDSLGHWIPPFNSAYWNGGKFRAIRTPIPGDSGQRLFSPFHFPLI